MDLGYFVGDITYWAWFGTLWLVVLTFQDFYNNMKIDDRYNWLMKGVTITLISYLQRNLFYMVTLLIVIIIFNKYFQRLANVGEGDVSALTWIILGYGIINPFQLGFFVVTFSFASLVYILAKKYIFKMKHETPFYIVILVTFIANNLIMMLY